MSRRPAPLATSRGILRARRAWSATTTHATSVAVFPRASLTVALFLVGIFASEIIIGGEERGHHDRPAIPEQILTESVTDIDANEAGEAEFVLNTQTLRARRGGSRIYSSVLEVEWRVLRDVGLRLEPAYVAAQDEAHARDHEFGLSAATSFALLHDFVRDIHLQAEVGLRIAGAEPVNISVPGDFSLPFTFGLRSAFRRGAWSLRPAAGIEAGGSPAHAPLWGGVGLLYALGEGGRYGFAGVELDADLARRVPLVVAPNLMADTSTLHLPFRVGVAVPWVIGASDTQPSIGVYLRVMVRTALD
jgi:hypothetical protein